MNTTEYLLTCLAEECLEAAQRASKALRFGLEEIQPEQEFSNAERIVHEFADILAVLDLLSEYDILSLDVASIVEESKQKKLKYMEYSRKCGTLND